MGVPSGIAFPSGCLNNRCNICCWKISIRLMRFFLPREMKQFPTMDTLYGKEGQNCQAIWPTHGVSPKALHFSVPFDYFPPCCLLEPSSFPKSAHPTISTKAAKGAPQRSSLPAPAWPILSHSNNFPQVLFQSLYCYHVILK